jgi:hypothetical protein
MDVVVVQGMYAYAFWTKQEGYTYTPNNQERCMYVCGDNQESIKSGDHLREEIRISDFLVFLQIVDPGYLVRDIMFIFRPRKEREISIMFIFWPRKEREISVAACTFMEDLRMIFSLSDLGLGPPVILQGGGAPSANT